MADHTYALAIDIDIDIDIDIEWTGNRGSGTTGYREYDREHTVSAPGKPTLHGSADPAFRGVPEAWNPGVVGHRATVTADSGAR